MLKNHIIIVVRNMLRHKFYSVLNILGLAIGLSTFLIIVLYLNNEKNYDNFNKDSDRILRVTQTNIWSKESNVNMDAVGPAVALVLKQEIPEIEEVCRVHPDGDYLGTYKNEATSDLISFDEKKMLTVDSNFFKIFSYPLKEGDPAKLLHKPNLVVVSEATAKKYFGDKSALGKTIKLSKGKFSKLFEVSGATSSDQNLRQNRII